MAAPMIGPLPDDISWGRGWGTCTIECERCTHLWIAVAPIGTMGLECPGCGHRQGFSLASTTDETPHDGAWLGLR